MTGPTGDRADGGQGALAMNPGSTRGATGFHVGDAPAVHGLRRVLVASWVVERQADTTSGGAGSARSRPSAQMEALSSPDGTLLHVRRWSPAGNAAGRPHVLVHGLASNLRTWDLVAASLAEHGHPVIAYDQRGHGRSQRPDHGYEMATAIEDLATVVASAGGPKPVIVGQSWGGNLVMGFAARHSDRIAGVVAVDGGAIDLAGRFNDWPSAEAMLRPPGPRPGRMGDARSRMRSMRPDWPDWGIEATLANLEESEDGQVRNRLPLDAHLQILRTMWDNPPPQLAALISAPVLFVPATGSERAPMRLEDTEAMAATLPRGRVVPIEGDHDLHIHRPTELTKAILDAQEWFG